MYLRAAAALEVQDLAQVHFQMAWGVAIVNIGRSRVGGHVCGGEERKKEHFVSFLSSLFVNLPEQAYTSVSTMLLRNKKTSTSTEMRNRQHHSSRTESQKRGALPQKPT